MAPNDSLFINTAYSNTPLYAPTVLPMDNTFMSTPYVPMVSLSSTKSSGDEYTTKEEYDARKAKLREEYQATLQKEREKYLQELISKGLSEEDARVLVDELVAKKIAPELEKMYAITKSPTNMAIGAGSMSALGWFSESRQFRGNLTKTSMTEATSKAMKANWDALKNSQKTFKEKLAESRKFNKAADDLLKRVCKFERNTKNVDNYIKVRNQALKAIKSGDINQIRQANRLVDVAEHVKPQEFTKVMKSVNKETQKAVADATRTATEKKLSAEATAKMAQKAADKAVAEAAAEAAANEATAAGRAVGSAGKSVLKTAGNTVTKTVGKVAGKFTAKCLPVVGTLAAAGFEIYEDKDKLAAARKKGGDAYAKQWVHTGTKAVAVLGGFAAGMKLGAVIGSCIPVPVVGTVVGAVVGGILGGVCSWLCGKAANKATTALVGPEPGVEAQAEQAGEELISKEKNQYEQLGDENFMQSGHGQLLSGILELQAEGNLSAKSVAIIEKYGIRAVPAAA